MKILITIADSDMDDVKRYCRLEGIDLHGRMQQELDKFISKARCQMEQRRKINKDLKAFVDTFKKAINAD